MYESAVAQTLNKLRLDDLNNVSNFYIFIYFFDKFLFKIRSFADYYSFLRGERVPTPSPEPLRLKSSTPVRLTTASIASSDLVLKGFLILLEFFEFVIVLAFLLNLKNFKLKKVN